ncbi:MAG: bifunctional methylenetetrahydrofolate dehydrogenase/methenyltetrahydrofolate cyclohydrolase FolD [Ignavibacteria bacterium]|jgi:methylenetetrahydrofolate dehydrogenase (NADP+)/methenyltetrahydrofolate cyclohydrolase|nr:bifunctional methylenetetrahydrofolate dehydrogenase/methenyltetrahydrofolate cyclohydrolase FolD [Ignavibacteria bacterium]
MAIIIDGKKISSDIKNELKARVENITAKGIKPKLALLLVGEDAASQMYVRSKERYCNDIGIESVVLRMPNTTTEEEVLDIIDKWNNDKTVNGILVQLPLPKHINESKVLLSISPSKDVDGFHPENVGRLVAGLPSYVPCTPLGIYELLKRYKINLKGKHCVVVGRSNIVGKPIANLLMQKEPNANAIVTVCHSAAPDISYYTKQADVLIAAVGSPELIKGEDVKEGVVVIDVGINRVEDLSTEKGYRVVGDVNFAEVSKKASAITPVPGGVGPMTISMLILNTLRSAEKEVYKD